MKYILFVIVINTVNAFSTCINMINTNSLYLNRREGLFLAASSPLFLKPDKYISIIGGNGETGKECVKILAEQGKNVKSISRSGFDFRDIDDNYKKYIEDIKVDIRINELDNIIKDSSSVIFLANAKKKFKYIKSDIEEFQNYEDIDVIGLKNIIKSCIKNDVSRFIYVSASCRSCLYDETLEYDKISGIECENCLTKQLGEDIIKNTNLDYTIVRIGYLINGENRGPKEIELTQDYSKSGMISRYDLANICVETINDKNTFKTTFEAYYRDTTQPYDVKESITKCTNLGKSLEECFFGSEFKDGNKPKNLEELRKIPIKGSLFTTGQEYSGDSWSELFKDLKKNKK